MNTRDKVMLLDNKYDVCGGSDNSGNAFIYDASTPRGACPLFKTLQSNSCSHDCKYCHNNHKARQRDATFQPKELAQTFLKHYQDRTVEGLFLSSGIVKDADHSTEIMLDTVKLLRNQYHYRGYIHFKILPGTSYHLVKEASEYASRMSINIETPNKSRMNELSSVKDYKSDILKRQAWIKKLHPNQTTQMIVGANDETDFEILKMANWEYDAFEVKRIYYSAFKPVKGTELEKREAAPQHRSNRLYNCDFLMRDYNVKFKEIKEILDDGMLPKQDPKLALAKHNFDGHIDINEAEYSELVRVPGIGPKTAKTIMQMQGKIKKYEDLYKLGVRIKEAVPFISVDGRKQRRLCEF